MKKRPPVRMNRRRFSVSKSLKYTLSLRASRMWQSVFPPWLPLWGSCHEVTERVQIALSALTGHLSHRERQVSLIRPLRRAPSPKGRQGLTPALHHWFAMTCVVRGQPENLWGDLIRLFEPPSPLRGRLIYSPVRVWSSLANLATMLLRASTASRLGMTMRPLNMSDISQTRETF